MAIFKCKMCGGTIEFNEDDTVGVCDSCGTKQTLPRLDDDKRANLYDRANHYRRNNDYDKAMSIFEQILNEDSSDAEAYWSLVLCKYGIEYVEDPKTHKRVPTVNRAQYTSVTSDGDYKSALKYADGYQKSIYEDEAKTIDEIQKGILEISNNEEPFDVFICYKETDDSGRRTQDSVYANDLYHQLTKEGFKVFFSRITLEDKLGAEYEPYIFAALNSAKVMVVIGTKPEYFNAVWVKNEWRRYLALIKKGENKMLVPAFRDMDPYDLPEEFSHLQAQDMSKLGFMQDLIHGIKKIVSSESSTNTKSKESSSTGNKDAKPLLERAFMFLEDGDFEEADNYCERVLDIDPKNARAYLGKMMAELGVRNEDELKDLKEPFDENSNYMKVLKYGDDFTDKINNYNKQIIYNQAILDMEDAKTIDDYIALNNAFERLNGFKNVESLKKQCLDQIEDLLKEEENKFKNVFELYSNGELTKTEAALKFGSIKSKKAKQESMKLWRDIINRKTLTVSENRTVCIKLNGKCLVVGDNLDNKIDISSWEDIVDISTNWLNLVGLKKDGTCVAVGDNEYGQCDVSKWEDIIMVSTEQDFTVGLKIDGTCVITGDNHFGECDVSNWNNIVSLSTYTDHIIGLKSDGTCIATGENYEGQCDVSEWKDIVNVSTGLDCTIGVKSDGTCMTTSKKLRVNKWDNIVAVSIGQHYVIGLKNDGTCVKDGFTEGSNVEDWMDIVDISACGNHTVGLKLDGTCVAAGDNKYGQCNVEDWKNIKVSNPVTQSLKEKLLKDQEKIKSEIEKLTNDLDNIEETKTIEKLENKIKLIDDKISQLGLFNVSEKKKLKSEKETLMTELGNLRYKVTEKRNEINKKIDTLKTSI